MSLADVAGEPFIDMPPGFGQRDRVDEAFARAGLTRRVRVEVPVITTIPEYVAHGLGVAFLPEALGVRMLRLDGKGLPWTLCGIRSARRKPARALHAFLGLLPRHVHHDRAF